MKPKKQTAMYHYDFLVAVTKDGSVFQPREVEVQVMAVVKGYAMVRRLRAKPFVVSLKELTWDSEEAKRQWATETAKGQGWAK